jgi:hypothetical protein
MFWSDPNLYGVSLYKDIATPVQAPILGPWYNIPRFIPQPYGFTAPLFGVPAPSISPFVRPETVNPYMAMNPYAAINPFMTPINPYLQHFGTSLPFYGWSRPFPFC